MISYPPEVEQTVIEHQDKYVWETPLFARYERGPKWYLFMSLAAVFLIAYAVYTANFLFAFIILLVAVLLLLAGNESPKLTLVQIGDHGVVWNGRLYLYQDLDHFGIVYQPPTVKTLYLQPKNSVMPLLNISLEAQDPVEIRNHLARYVREDYDLRDEHFSDIFARLLKL
ncbi:MAG: hypothetical protein WCV84_00885 [Patescibacteria group bacterium]